MPSNRNPNLHQSGEILHSIIDSYRMPVVLLNESGNAWLQNQEMGRLSSTSSPILIEDHSILIKDANNECNSKKSFELKTKIENVLNKELRSESVQLDKGKYLVISLLKSHSKSLYPFKVALISLVDSRYFTVPSESCFRRLFNLNKTESEVCQLMLKNYSVKKMCEYKNITENTGREYIKRVLKKTGSKNLFELINLLSSLSVTKL